MPITHHNCEHPLFVCERGNESSMFSLINCASLYFLLVVGCHRPPVPKHGSTEGLFLHSGSRITYRCDPGFELQGFRTAICLTDGTWSATAPECGKIKYGIQFLPNSNLEVSVDLDLGSQCGTLVFVSFSRSLRDDVDHGKQLDFLSLSLVPVERVCTLPPKPVNGDHLLVYGPNDVLIALQYMCNQPYELIGISQRTCLPNNTWSGTPPVCSKGQTMFPPT